MKIQRDPKNAALYLKRGELYRFRRQWDRVLADYRRARRLDPEMSAVDLCSGILYLESDRPQMAKAPLERFLSGQPDDVGARIARARVSTKLNEPDLALADYLSRPLTTAFFPTLLWSLRRWDPTSCFSIGSLDSAVLFR